MTKEEKSKILATAQKQVARADAINQAIERWTNRPPLNTPIYAAWNTYKPKPANFVYWAGRFHDTSHVLDSLGKRLGTVNPDEIIRHSFVLVFGQQPTSFTVVRMIEHTIEDFRNGAKLPPWVMQAYVELESRLPK